MSKLEIRNLQSSKLLQIEAQGVIFGREGGEADIKLPDPGVSKTHARIYAKRGAWFLEDLDSANGTYLEDSRIGEPVALAPGQIFTMSRQQFEVMRVMDEESSDSSSAPGSESDTGVPRKSAPPVRRPSRGEAQRPVKAARASTPSGMSESTAAGDAKTNAPQESFAAVITFLPSAVGYYLKTVPLLVMNPFGTVRNSVEEQPLPAMGPFGLLGYALPAAVFTALVGALCQLIVQIATHTLSIGGLIPIVPLAIAGVSAVVASFLFHPVLEWIITRLQGDSDAVGRSNLFVLGYAAAILSALPAGLAVVIALIHVPFIGIVPGLLSVWATVVTLLVVYRWLQAFGVVKWFELAVLGLGLVGVLFSAIGVIRGATSSFGRGGPMVASATPVDAPTAPETATPSVHKGTAVATAATPSRGDPRLSSSPPRMAAAAPVRSDPPRPARTVEPPPPSAPVAVPVNPPAPSATPEPSTVPAVAVQPPRPTSTVAPAAATEPARNAAPKISYRDFHDHRDQVEKMVADDPTLLRRPGARELYSKLHKLSYDIEQRSKLAERRQHDPSQAVPNARYREAELYDQTAPTVEELYRVLTRP